MLKDIIIPFIIAVLSGIILLIFEYRTNWFTKQASKLTRSDLLQPIETNKLEIHLSRGKWIFGTLIFSVFFTGLIMAFLSNSVITNLEQQLKTYEQYSEWNLPEMLTNLYDISQELNLTIQDRKKLLEYDAMNKQISLLKEENQKLKTQLSNFIFQSNVIKVAEGETVTLIDGYYFLGLETVFGSSVSVNINGVNDIMNLTDEKLIYDSHINIECKLFLMKINYDDHTAEFKFYCN